MMFNVPIPGGTTGHAVGGVLLAILCGPWAACLAVSVALALQAFLFGDGGLTAFGANCFNMAFVMPFTGYYIYRALSLKSKPLRHFEESLPRELRDMSGLVIASACRGR